MKLYDKKALYKSLTWRAVSVISSLAVSIWLMGNLQEAIKYTIIYNLINTVLYYFHEMAYKGKKL